jgi:hypothetical protein
MKPLLSSAAPELLELFMLFLLYHYNEHNLPTVEVSVRKVFGIKTPAACEVAALAATGTLFLKAMSTT